MDVEIINVGDMTNQENELLKRTNGSGYDDVLVMAPVPAVLEVADSISGVDSCINFFAGPTRKDFYARVNFYDVHYNYKHVIGTSGGDLEDMKETLKLIENDLIDPAIMVSHIGGLKCVADATLNLPQIPGAKKLIYCHIDMDLVAIEDFEEKGRNNPLFRELDLICRKHDGLWSREAEEFLLSNVDYL